MSECKECGSEQEAQIHEPATACEGCTVPDEHHEFVEPLPFMTVDPETGAIYVRLMPTGTKVTMTRDHSKSIHVITDWTADEQLIGVEILP